jgi:site-specific DNA-methyltransferase (adenine-specific)
MSYLVTLGSRKDELVLDPFVGSGTTCIAANLLDRKYLGMEMDDEYVVIAEERIKASKKGKIKHDFF